MIEIEVNINNLNIDLVIVILVQNWMRNLFEIKPSIVGHGWYN